MRPISSETIDLPLTTRRALGVAADAEDDVAGFRGGSRPVNVRAGAACARLERLEVEVEICQRVVADVAGRGAQRLELGEARPWRPRAAATSPPGNPASARGKRRIGERALGVGLEVLAARPSWSSGSGDWRSASSPASTSAT